MNSTQKVYGLLEELQDCEDEELREAIPLKGVPIPMARGALAAVAGMLPDDPLELDGFLEQVSTFCLSIRSDERLPEDQRVEQLEEANADA